ncbi:MAG: Mini-ribonuclease 3 [Enterococcus sp.]|nr:Mini-ribonuclease 3 [Enterococcus sp.]
MRDHRQLNGLALAYVGDAVYEIYIREHLVNQGQARPSQLHRLATHYVSAKAQAMLIQKMLDEKLLTPEEEDFYRRGRNSKSQTSAKNTEIKLYRMSTGFEAVMGFLYLTKQTERLENLITWCIEQIDLAENKGGK